MIRQKLKLSERRDAKGAGECSRRRRAEGQGFHKPACWCWRAHVHTQQIRVISTGQARTPSSLASGDRGIGTQGARGGWSTTGREPEHSEQAAPCRERGDKTREF